MSPLFIYNNDIPDAILPEIKRVLEPWAWIVPAWCERVFVEWSNDSDSDDATARCRVEYPYRWAQITFFPCFLSQSDPLADALHELLHIPLGVLSDWTRETIKRLVSEDDAPIFRKTLLDELTVRVESVVEDIARRISVKEGKQIIPGNVNPKHSVES